MTEEPEGGPTPRPSAPRGVDLRTARLQAARPGAMPPPTHQSTPSTQHVPMHVRLQLSDPTWWTAHPADLAAAVANAAPEAGDPRWRRVLTAAQARVRRRHDQRALPKKSRRPLPEGVPRKQLDRLTYTVEEAATVLGISRSLAYEAVARGEVPHLRVGRRVLIPRGWLEEWIGGASAGGAPDTADPKSP